MSNKPNKYDPAVFNRDTLQAQRAMNEAEASSNQADHLSEAKLNVITKLAAGAGKHAVKIEVSSADAAERIPVHVG